MDDQQLTRFEGKLDKITDRIEKVDVTLAKQEISLSEHMRRTNLLEAKLEPVERHVNMISGALKLVGISASAVAIAEGLLAVLHYLGFKI